MIEKLVASIVVGLVLVSSSWAAPKPNIVSIMADDLSPGWVDYDGSNPETNTLNPNIVLRKGPVVFMA